MTRTTRDPRREKLRDMRRVPGDRLWDMFRKVHPEFDWVNRPKNTDYAEWRLLFSISHEAGEEWIRRVTGCRHVRSWGAPPAWFRRGLNKLRRSREKQAMREQLARGGDVTLPRSRRNARWLWW